MLLNEVVQDEDMAFLSLSLSRCHTVQLGTSVVSRSTLLLFSPLISAHPNEVGEEGGITQ